MALQTHSAAMHPLRTTKIAVAGGGAGIPSATLKATLQAQLVTDGMAAADATALLNRVKHMDIRVQDGTLFMSDAGQTATANSMPYEIGEKRQIRNCKELLGVATVFVTIAAVIDLRIELYS